MYFVRYKCMSPSEKFHYIYSQTHLSIVKYQRLNSFLHFNFSSKKYSVLGWF